MATELKEGDSGDKLLIELTNHCNFKCDFCPQPGHSRPRCKMDFDLFRQIIDEAAGRGLTRTIGFHVMGEPMLHPRLDDAIGYAKDAGLRVELTTNGSLLRPDRVARLAERRLDKLNISLLTNDPGEHTYRGSRFGFDRYYGRILDAVRMTQARGGSPHVQLALMSTWSKRYFTVPRAFELNRRKRTFRARIVRLICDVYQHLGHPLEAEQVTAQLKRVSLRRDVTLALQRGLEIFIRTFADWGNAFTDRKIYPARVGFCSAAMRTASILSNGDVVPCCGDYNGEAKLGNVRDESLEAILNGPRAREIVEGFRRLRVVHPRCQRCIGGSSPLKATLKGLLSIWLFKLRSPVDVPEIPLFGGGLPAPERLPALLPQASPIDALPADGLS